MADITIECFSSEEYSSSKKVGSWTGEYYPDSLDVSISNSFKRQKGIGLEGPPVYYGESKKKMTFPLLFDNTFRANEVAPKPGKPIPEQVEAFLKLTQKVNSESHTSNYLKVTSGKFIFCGQACSVSVKYSFFNKEGQPQRAVVQLGVSASETIAKKKSEAGLKSPDLTRSVVVQEGDSLPGFSQKFYDTPHYYMELAAFNGLKNIRSLQVGTRLIIPPLQS